MRGCRGDERLLEAQVWAAIAARRRASPTDARKAGASSEESREDRVRRLEESARELIRKAEELIRRARELQREARRLRQAARKPAPRQGD